MISRPMTEREAKERIAELEQALAQISNRMIRRHSRAEIQNIVRGVLPLPAQGEQP